MQRRYAHDASLRAASRDNHAACIRRWHAHLTATVSPYTANVARKHLRVSLALAAEDFNLRVAAMPTRLGRGRPKSQKVILDPAHVAKLLRSARQDPWGLYYAWPFLTGTRPSEQLGLLWEDIDLEARVIHVRRVLERDGTLSRGASSQDPAQHIGGSPRRGACARQDRGLRAVVPRPQARRDAVRSPPAYLAARPPAARVERVPASSSSRWQPSPRTCAALPR
jgi:integrase